MNSYISTSAMYYQIACGAVYSQKKLPKDIFGDYVGENISFKRDSFCEFTVHFWSWKNYDLDYYGLCHYRRFLVLNKGTWERNCQNIIIVTADA